MASTALHLHASNRVVGVSNSRRRCQHSVTESPSAALGLLMLDYVSSSLEASDALAARLFAPSEHLVRDVKASLVASQSKHKTTFVSISSNSHVVVDKSNWFARCEGWTSYECPGLRVDRWGVAPVAEQRRGTGPDLHEGSRPASSCVDPLSVPDGGYEPHVCVDIIDPPSRPPGPSILLQPPTPSRTLLAAPG